MSARDEVAIRFQRSSLGKNILKLCCTKIKDAYKYAKTWTCVCQPFFKRSSVDAVWSAEQGDQSYASQNTDMLVKSAIRHAVLDGRQVFFGGDDEELFGLVGGKRVA